MNILAPSLYPQLLIFPIVASLYNFFAARLMPCGLVLACETPKNLLLHKSRPRRSCNFAASRGTQASLFDRGEPPKMSHGVSNADRVKDKDHSGATTDESREGKGRNDEAFQTAVEDVDMPPSDRCAFCK